jgi:hypothetical protein
MCDRHLDSGGGSAYLIELVGILHEADINPASPYDLERTKVGVTTSTFSLTSDQAGLIGLLRYLHGRGLVLQSVRRVQSDELG